ncbi:2Fe-2S iron-sulfur cluster-binding protein [Nostocoides australiense]
MRGPTSRPPWLLTRRSSPPPRRAGVEVITSCAQGVCGTCDTEVLEGEPDHRDSLLDDSEREIARCLFPCVSRSRSERLVLDL